MARVFQREQADKIHCAACVIARAWRSYSRRLTFKALKDALYKAERSLTFEILRKLAPKEAELLKDPTVQVRVRFRFAGTSWPPKIQYKIFTKGNNVHYFSGLRIIKPGSMAAFDACRVMGARLYTELNLVEDSRLSSTVTNPYEVTNRMEYVKYVNDLDYRPAHLGGRNNGWRDLSFNAFSSESVFFDIEKFQKPPPSIDRRRRLPKRKPDPTRVSKNMVEMDDDFGTLFEWTNSLKYEDLHDFQIQ
ncbi:hypothetical protein BC829DRAFT_486837 [Chytridium lagenaria]|nr:hypothetical protein BC829DRAFT_486837 [Chytridium lagenaria]